MQKENIHILIVDDNPVDLEIIRAVLNGNYAIHYTIDAASTGMEALEKASTGEFHLALLDYNLHDMNGIEILEEIKTRSIDLPVIMVTGEGDEKIAKETIKKGAYDYLIKDEINNILLTRTIRSVLERKNLEDKLKAYHDKLEDLAIKDGLTGLYNHRHFQEILSSEFKRSKRYVQPLSCMMLDLDHFKLVNDSHGHQYGDFVLAQSAGILRRFARDTDFIARYGGEEFVIILPNTDLEGVLHLAEKIRNSFENNPFKKEEISESISISIGVSSTADSNVSSKDDLITNADTALYQAKSSGRNNVCAWEEIESEDSIDVKEEYFKITDFYNRIKNLSEDMKEPCVKSVQDIFCELEAGCDYFNDHSLRVCLYAEKLARELLMSDEEINVIKYSALLHDIGMVGINSDILKKKDVLSPDEYDLLKRHVNIGADIVGQLKLFGKELQMIHYHHERFDGSGYPHKLRGRMIPLGARILAIAEAYDSMTSETMYRKARSSSEAIEELRKCAGSQFDPKLVEAFIKAIKRPDKPF